MGFFSFTLMQMVFLFSWVILKASTKATSEVSTLPQNSGARTELDANDPLSTIFFISSSV